MNADSIKIESDEDGFHLIVETDGPEPWQRIDFRLLCPGQFLEEARREIGPWLAEQDTARREFRRNPDESAGLRDLAVATAYDTAYEINDPKHPDYHSVHADLHDLRQP